MKRADDNLSIWLDADTRTFSDDTDVDEEPGTQTLNELIELADCFDLLERVWPTPAEATSTRAIGDVIGPYTLVQEIGQGGMGTVWEAKQEIPLKRRLAIKFVSSDMSGERVIQRFDSERNLLARMEHPGITRVLDAGTDDDGRPWFAMELVDGQDIMSFCKTGELSLDARLRLFVAVCEAIQHAHQKGVIHRDLKPSNVLVQTVDGKPEVKVIDFGLARALDRDEFAVTAETKTGAILGSLWHMSPEQTISGADVDTRTDVYLLGALLYRVLTGEYLLDRDVLESRDFAKTLVAIQEQQPSRPSQRVTNDWLETFSTEAGSVRANLRGELDWIVMRAIEKQPDRRYGTVAELMREVERFLNDEPINAKPPSRLYSAGKYIRRNKAFVTAIASIATAIVLTAVIATIGYVRVSEASDDAQKSLARARTSNSILSGIFEDLDLDSVDASTEPLRMQLGRRLVEASRQLQPDSVGKFAEVAELQFQLGKTLNSLHLHDEAVSVCERAYEGLREIEPNAAETREAARQLAFANLRSGRFDVAGDLLQAVLKDTEVHGSELEVLETLDILSEFCFFTREVQRATELAKRVDEGKTRLLGPTHPKTLAARTWLARLYVFSEREDLAVPILEECVAVLRESRPRHPQTISTISILAWAYGRDLRHGEGPPLAREAYELARVTFGEEHEVTYNALVQVGISAGGDGQFEQARQYLTTAIKGLRSTDGAETWLSVDARAVLTRIYQSVGAWEIGLDVAEENVQLRKQRYPADHPITLESLTQLAEYKRWVTDYAGARSILLEVLKVDDLGGLGLLAKRELGNVYFDEGKYSEAVEVFQELCDEASEVEGPFGFNGVVGRAELAKALDAAGQSDKAIELLESFELPESMEPMGVSRRKQQIIEAQLGIVFANNGRVSEGVPLIEPLTRQRIKPIYRTYLLQHLRRAWVASGQTDRVVESIRYEVEMSERQFEPNSKLMGARLLSLGADLIEFEKYDTAIELLDRAMSIAERGSWEYRLAKVRRDMAAYAALDENAPDDAITKAVDDVEASFTEARKLQDVPYPLRRRQLIRVANDVAGLMEARGQDSSAWQSRAREAVR